MKKLVLFDFDGVIADTFEFCFTEVGKIVETHDRTTYRKHFEGNIIKTSIDRLGEEVVRRIYNQYHNGILSAPLFESIASQIKNLSEDYTLLIISSAAHRSITRYLAHHKLLSYFHSLHGRDTGESKTDKIRSLLTSYRKHPEQCLMITDTLGDIYEANEASIPVLAVLWGFHKRNTLERGNPAGIIESPEDLEAAIRNHFATIK